MKKKQIIGLLFCVLTTSLFAQKTNAGFKVIPLGVRGGLDEANLSAYLVAAKGTNEFICLDAGTIYAGIEKGIANKLFTESTPSEVQKKQVKAYFISHGHLDHLAGLVLNAPSDSPKPIYALPSVIDVLKNNYFTWKSWANFANEGDKPTLGKYNYQNLVAAKEIAIPNTPLYVTPYILSHVNPYESTAFLVKSGDNYLLYLGDTGADTVEKSNQLLTLWTSVAPLVKTGKLASIFIEVSFDNSMPDKALFGHLTPKLLIQELSRLNQLSAGKLINTKIVVTHIKPCSNCEQNIQQQIKEANNLGLTIVFPEQGKQMEL